MSLSLSVFFSRQAVNNSSETKRLQSNDVEYGEAFASSQLRNKIQLDGVSAEQNASILKASYRYV